MRWFWVKKFGGSENAPHNSSWAGRILGDGIVIALLVAWYLAALRTPEYVLPNPTDTLAMTLRLFVDPALATHTYLSLARVLAAVILALVIGAALVTVSHVFPVTRLLIAGRLTPFLNAFPTLGWAMMAIFWFGISTVSVIFVEVAILLPFCIINLSTGVRNLDYETLEMGMSFTRSRTRLLKSIVIPLLFPYILAAVRVCYGVAWKVALIAELFGARGGLGYLLNVGRSQFDSVTIFAAVVAIVILVFIVDRLILQPMERYASRYR